MGAKPHLPTIDQLIELPMPNDAQISPDGTSIAYTVIQPDWEENEYVSQIWLVAANQKNAEPRQLTFAKSGSRQPRWSPDGQWLAFLSKREGDEQAQIYRISPWGGEGERLTKIETSIHTINWSPDGQSIGYTATDTSDEAHNARQKKYGDYAVEDEDHQRAHLWLLQLSDKKCRKLTSGDSFHVINFDWHPGGHRIAFQAAPTPDISDWENSRIYTIDLSRLAVTPLTEPRCGSPYWSPDGSQLVFSQSGSPSYYMNNDLCVLSIEGGEQTLLTESFDEEVYPLAWRPSGIYFGAFQKTAGHLFHADPENGAINQVTPSQSEGWVSSSWSFDQAGQHAATIQSDTEHLNEVMTVNLKDRSVKRHTQFSDKVNDWQLSRHELFQWTSQDGTPIEGVLTKPPDFDPQQRYPLLVVIHGGPTGISHPGVLGRYERNYYPIQQWAAKGALILQPNYRGSAGYGEAFRALNAGNLGLGDYDDVISGVDALIEKGWVDPERVGSMGWSQGGYISAFITTYSQRFKAVSVGAGISNWMTYYVNTDIHPFTRQYLHATPWDDPDVYARTSPMTYIKQAQTPTLIQHGELDRRVPIPNAYELYQGLQDMGVETKLVVYKGMPHGITKPRQNRQVMTENLNWFNRWIWDEQPEAEPKPPCYVLIAPAKADKTANLSDLSSVQDVIGWAYRDGAEFRLLSATSGLISIDEAGSGDGQRLQVEGVSTLATRIAQQLQDLGSQKLVLYASKVSDQPDTLIYLGCLQVAAGVVGGITVEHQEIDEAGW